MLNSVGARTHPWFTPLRISNGSDVTPSYTTVLFMLLWKEEITLSSFVGQPIFSSRLNNPRLLTRSNAFVRSIIGQSIYAKLWLNPPQIATEAFSSDLLPERCPE